ncbi:MAG: XRE family transcriptional regulator [Sphingobacteriia bacterium]|nr:MAG: XRE family transcriptional regulator [Sphingobacteriia bacterium]
MIENSVTNIIAESDKSILERIGQFVKETRLSQNKTQQQLADDAGIARSTLTLLESGAGGTLLSLIQVLRILDQLSLLKTVQVSTQVSPLLLAKQAKNKRQRASQQADKNNHSTSW